MSADTNNMNLIKGAYQAFSQGDVPAVLALMDENIAWHEPEGFLYGGTFNGPQDVLDNMFMKLGTEWTGWQATPQEYIDGGDVVVVLGQYSGTYNETGKEFSSPFVHIWRMENGKVSEFRTHMDTAVVQAAVS